MPVCEGFDPVGKATVLALLILGACTTNTIDLAPADPRVPWKIERPPVLESGVQRDQTTARVTTPEGAVPIDAGRPYGLAELIDLAQRRNPETRDAWERARQAALGVGLADSAYLPQISAEAVGGYQNTTLPVPTNVVPTGRFTAETAELLPTLAIKWLLFDFGRRAGNDAAARAESFVTNVAFTGAHQRLIFAVSRDYFALGAARGRLRVAEDAFKNAQIVEAAAKARRGTGLATTVEVVQAERHTAEARFNLVHATGDEHSAYHALLASMGVPPTVSINVADNSAQSLPSAPAETVDQYVAAALENRPDVVAALGSIRAAQAKLDTARADYNPTVSLLAQGYQNIGALSVNGSRYFTVNEPSGSILLKFSWPLYDGGARDARLGIARSAVEAAHDQLEQTRDAAVKQVTDSYDALRTGLSEYAAAVALRKAAATAYDAALDVYRHGRGTYTDLVNDETALARSQSELENARATAFTAAAALAFATGSISAPSRP